MGKVVLVQPKVRWMSTWESLACGYLISYAEKHGHFDEIEFYSQFFDSDETIIKGCNNASIVGFSCTSPQMKFGLELAQRIKEVNPYVWIVFGGVHPSALPMETLKHPQVDQVIVGEGERSFLRVLQGNRDKIVWTEPIQNLDDIPFPNRIKIRSERCIQMAYRNNKERIASILTSRGCPMHCVFCSDHIVWGRKTRRRSVSNVLDEIAQVVNDWRIDFLKAADAEINSDPMWLLDFCKEKIKRGIDVEMGANIHAGLCNRKMFNWMKRAGFREIWIGVETGSPRILRQIRKGTTIEQIKRAFKWSKDAGLLRRAYFMVGMPDETLEDVKLTFRLAEEIEPDIVGMTILCPYPRTEIYMRDPDRFKDWDWSVCDEYGNPYWKTETFSNEDLKAIQRNFMDKFKDRLCYRLRKKN
jgi:radical SAM superfamily enzyme YgiQ (UPF0313 family)